MERREVANGSHSQRTTLPMIVKQKANVYARALGLSEVQNAKLTAAALITALVAAVCVAAITVTLFFTFKELRAAEADRVMHGYIGKDGHFISAKVTPDHYVKAFVNDFILHYFNLSPETVEDRLNYARKMMAPNYRIREESGNDQGCKKCRSTSG
jgi:hypothetical protein